MERTSPLLPTITFPAAPKPEPSKTTLGGPHSLGPLSQFDDTDKSDVNDSQLPNIF